MKRYLLVLGATIVTALLTGCGLSTPVKLPQQLTYTLNSVKPSAAASSHRSKSTILVSLPIPDPGFASNMMVYEPIPFDLRSFSQHQWAAPPAHMLMPLLAQALSNLGYFKGVMTTPFSGTTDYNLDSRLVALKQSFLRPQSREVLILQETLTNNTDNQVIASRRFSAVIPASHNNPYSGVVAANKAARIVTGEVARWVNKMI